MDTIIADAPAEADILPFPAHRARPPSPQSRLARALDSLRDALAEQHQAAVALQGASAQLRATLAELHARLESHQAGLGRLAGDVNSVNAQAQRLEGWADGILARP